MTWTLLLAMAPAALGADANPLRAGMDVEAGWAEVGRERFDGVGEVVVRYKVIDGSNCLEGTTRTSVSADLLLSVVADVEHHSEFSSWELPESKRLGNVGSSFDYYQLLDNPSPVSDRAWFVRSTMFRRGEDRVFTWDQIDGAALYPEVVAGVKQRHPDVVFTALNVGDWTFTPDGPETKVRYRICTDAGGSLPMWLGEIAARKTLPTNVADMVRAALSRSR